MTSAQIIASLPMNPGFSTSQINRLCREGKLYGYKVKEENFEPWIIPEDSFALFLKYSPILLIGFMEMDMKYDRGGELTMFVDKVKKYLSKNYTEESYTLTQLSYIFDKPTNQIATWFHISCFAHFILKSHINISALDVVRYLAANPNRLNVLKERHKLLLANGDHTESAVRHLLMLHAYYESNGHLN